MLTANDLAEAVRANTARAPERNAALHLPKAAIAIVAAAAAVVLLALIAA